MRNCGLVTLPCLETGPTSCMAAIATCMVATATCMVATESAFLASDSSWVASVVFQHQKALFECHYFCLSCCKKPSNRILFSNSQCSSVASECGKQTWILCYRDHCWWVAGPAAAASIPTELPRQWCISSESYCTNALPNNISIHKTASREAIISIVITKPYPSLCHLYGTVGRYTDQYAYLVMCAFIYCCQVLLHHCMSWPWMLRHRIFFSHMTRFLLITFLQHRHCSFWAVTF